MARSAFACKASARFSVRQKKRAVKLGDLTALLTFRQRGALFHRKVTLGSGLFDPRPGGSRQRGATDAGDAFQLFDHDSTEPDHNLICFFLSLSQAARRRNATIRRS